MQQFLVFPDGANVGKPLKLAEFMKDDLRAIYDNPYTTRRAIISRARKNSKTFECAAIVLLHLVGPEARRNSQLYSCAQSRDQAAVLFDYARKVVQLHPELRNVVHVRESAKQLVCEELGTTFQALSADSTTAMGRNPVLTIHDELGQVRGPRFSLYEAMETGTAVQEDPLTIVISTQAPTDGDLLSILIDDAKSGADGRVVLRLDTTPMHMDPFSEEAIRAANPAFDVFMNKKEILAMAEDARRMPSREAEYRNLILNQRVEASSPFVKPNLWNACNGEVADFEGRECFGGLDLSEANDLTALVLICRINNTWHVRPTFWLPEQNIHERSHQDRVPYDQWAHEGYLHLTPGNSISYEWVAHELRRLFERFSIKKCAFDQWNMRHLHGWLVNAGFSEQMIAERFVEFSQSAKSMAPALRELESAILEKEIAHGDHPVLRMCFMNAVTEGHDSSVRRLSKRRSTGRIDGAIGLAMAIGCAPLKGPKIDIESLIGDLRVKIGTAVACGLFERNPLKAPSGVRPSGGAPFVALTATLGKAGAAAPRKELSDAAARDRSFNVADTCRWSTSRSFRSLGPGAPGPPQ
jgi:phage terminase large subunit-like protein